MSDRNSDVFQVLVASGNQAVLAAGSDVGALQAGQLGVFDANSHLSIDASASPKPKEIYLAVGINRSGGAGFEDFRQSAGQLIQRKNINNYTFGPHSAARPMIVDVTNIKATCEKDYTIRVEQRNSKIAGIMGYNQFSEAFSIRGACCEGCADDCTEADPNDVAIKMVNEINTNNRTGLSASLFASVGSITITAEPTANGNVTVTLGTQTAKTVAILDADTTAQVATKIAASVTAPYSAKAIGNVVYVAGPVGTITYAAGTTGATATDVDVTRTAVTDSVAFLNTNPNAVLGFSITAAPAPTINSDGINLRYHKLHETFIIVSLVEGFDCSGTVTVSQEMAYEEGSGQNIKQLEYMASGWNGAGPYVASDMLGLAIGNLEYFAKDATKYDQIDLEYFFKHQTGWLNYENGMRTTIAIPEASTTTRNGLLTILDALTGDLGFDALLDDAAVASTNPAVVESQPASAAVDGIA